MAIDKATTKADLSAEDLTASAVDPQPTRADLVARVEEHTDPSVLAEVKQPKTVKVKSPTGFVSEVPESILDSLLDSGYSKSK